MPSNFAIITTGGKQYKVSTGDKLKIEKLDVASNGAVFFDAVLLRVQDGKVEVGAPHVAGAKIQARIVGAGRGEKKIVFKYHSKTRRHTKKGHRQEYSEIEIL